MATLSVQNPTLLDLAKRQDPDGKIADIVELLSQSNGILDDMTFVEGNLPTGHKTTVRTGLPEPTWRAMYQGVQPQKSRTAQITDTCGMLEAYGEIDKALADLNGNTAEFRFSEERGYREGINQEMAETLFYGNETTEPAAFTGFAPRFNSLSAANAENIIDAGGTGTDNASIWLIGWSDQTCHGIIPKGSVAGLQVRDLGEVTDDAPDGNGKMQLYRTHYRWDAGLCVRDWRYVVRACNIDKSLLQADAASGANLVNLMVQMLERLPDDAEAMTRLRFYVPRHIREYLRLQITNAVKNATLTMDTVAGKKVLSFDGVPVRRVDRLAADEARVV